MVRIRQDLPALPERSETFPLHEPFSSVFEALADNANHLAGYRFLRCTPVIVAPFTPDTSADTQADTTVHASWVPSEFSRYLFVAVGYSRLGDDTATISLSLRQAHATTPGSGAIIDPGCQWKKSNGNLVAPIEHDVYKPSALQWAHTGLRVPNAVNVADPPANVPRMLHCHTAVEVELALVWKEVTVNSVLIWEAYRAEV